MKKIISLILVFALLFTGALSVVALEAGKYTTSQTSSLKKIAFVTEYESDTPNVKLVGRTNPAYPLLIGYHGSGVEFKVTGTEVVGVRIQSYNTNSHSPIPLYFEINGEQVVIEGADKTTQGTYDYIIKTDLDANTTYNVKVLQDKENWAQYSYHGFYITHAVVDNVANANVSKAKDGDYKILVLGDSITSANNIGGVHLSYHQLMAKNFTADTQVMSAGGGLLANEYTRKNKDTGVIESVTGQIKLARDWNSIAWDNRVSPINEMYDADDDGTRDSYETDPNNVKFPADLVLFNIGTNDQRYLFGDEGYTFKEDNKTNFTNDFYATLDEMFGFGKYEGKGYYPNTTVVLSFNLMGDWPGGMRDFYKKTLIPNYLEMHPELVGTGPDGNDRLTTFFYTHAKYGTVSSSDQHPNTASHAYAAEELTTFLSDYMGWEVKPEIQAYPNNDGVLETLPEIERKENELFLGFTDDDDSYVKKGGQIAWDSYIYSNYLPFELGGFVNPDGIEQGKNAVDTTAKYTNGFYIQGAQVRVVTDEEYNVNEEKTGLRFIIVNNTKIKTVLQEAIEQNFTYERGVMVAPGTKFTGGELLIDTACAKNVPAKKIFATTATTGTDYDKYTACIIGITEPYFDEDVIVRPYFKYTDNSGVEHVYYGEQYSCSLYDAAYDAYGNEEEVVNNYLNDAIISKCKGDNDLNDLPF